MTIEKLSVPEFIEKAKTYPVLDVRSPAEFSHAHIPGAYSLPLFTDEERSIVGTAYKQESREAAIKIGLKYYGIKMVKMVEDVEAIYESHFKNRLTNNNEAKKIVLVHCWRGGMRSAGVAWLLDLYGFKVFTLTGGYKFFRRWALEQFEKEYSFHVVGGYTGSGKTEVLQNLKRTGACTIDLESIAGHKGSAFGNLARTKQPSQEMFENILALKLNAAVTFLREQSGEKSNNFTIWIEDESQRIGDINLPPGFYKGKQSSPLFFLDVPFDERLNHIVQNYGGFDREKILNAIMRIKKRLGGLETKTAVNYLLEDDIKNCFAVLLKYYDKWYLKSMHQRENLESILMRISCETANTAVNVNSILKASQKKEAC